MKVLRITMPDGSEWEVPASLIAKHRAGYYEYNEQSTAYKNEFQATMQNDYTLLDWAPNNMDWSDVSAHAKQVMPPNPPEVDFQEAWVNGPKEIRDIP